MLKFALAGNPNSGKTTLFNNLTGSTAHVGNWPGVTVDKKEGTYKKCAEPISIVDLPGIYSLSPYTPEEIITRNFILDEQPDCVINIVDATNLERNLYLTTQIMEIDVPMIIALNMIDEVKKSGATIDGKTMEEKIGIPVVEISALKGIGIDLLMKRAYEVCKEKRKGTTVLKNSALSHLINDVKIALSGSGKVDNPLFHAIKLVEMDVLEKEAHKELIKLVDDFKETFDDDVFGSDFEAVVADSRYKYISANFSTVLTKPKSDDKGFTKSDKIDLILTHKWWGIPIFLIIMFAVFHLTFSEDLFYLGTLGIIPDNFVSLKGTIFEGLLGSGAVNSPGVILFNFLDSCTGALNDIIVAAMENNSQWAVSLVSDGILGGIFSILSFLPQILILFLFFSILEDSGYMARAAFILDRIFRKFGLSGRAFLPMIMGFGCSVPAMINTRTLADENERTATIRVIPFFSCGAKLPILTAIAGGIVMQFGVGNADVITYSMYILGITVAVLSVMFMKNTTMKGDSSPFIMELPAYHSPQFKNLMLHLWDKVKHFIKKAFTIILASSIVIWFISHFSWNWEYLPEKQINESILAGIGQLIQPIFTPLGFGSQLKSFGWVFVVAAITGLIAKENVIATLGTLAATISSGFVANEALGGIDSVTQIINATEITIPALLAFIAFNMTTIPCFAAVATAKAELSKKRFNYTLLFWLAVSYIVGSVIYITGSWWWSVFIFAVIAFVTVIGIVLKNRYKPAVKKQKENN
ncbi:MAG: ferrous iron transport protein B [Clostridia bacterium]|nr:ferrous iron transport protein B [Clostridia bacterium]